MSNPLTREQHLDLYYFMQLNRQLEERMVRLFRQNKIVGGLYSSLGQEGVSVGTGVRAREARLDRADDPQYRRVAGERSSAARYFHAAHGEVHFADAGQGRHQPFRRFESAAHRFADFDAGRFDSGDDGRGHGGALSGPEDRGA